MRYCSRHTPDSGFRRSLHRCFVPALHYETFLVLSGYFCSSRLFARCALQCQRGGICGVCRRAPKACKVGVQRQEDYDRSTSGIHYSMSDFEEWEFLTVLLWAWRFRNIPIGEWAGNVDEMSVKS